MKEVYVSFEVAKLLKEKGFDWDCHHFYYRKNNGKIVEKWMQFVADRNSDRWINKCAEYVSAPTQQMACRWLREEKNIYITAVPDIGNSLRFYPAIYVVKGEIPEEYWFEYINSVVEELNKSYGSPQQAVEVALQYCLTNLI